MLAPIHWAASRTRTQHTGLRSVSTGKTQLPSSHPPWWNKKTNYKITSRFLQQGTESITPKGRKVVNSAIKNIHSSKDDKRLGAGSQIRIQKYKKDFPKSLRKRQTIVSNRKKWSIIQKGVSQKGKQVDHKHGNRHNLISKLRPRDPILLPQNWQTLKSKNVPGEDVE